MVCNPHCNSEIVKLFCDNHGLANKLMTTISNNANFMGWVKPGAKMEVVINNIIQESKKLSWDDSVVIVGGTNNVVNGGCNNFDHELDSVLGVITAPKVLLVGLPIRYDCPLLSKVVSYDNNKLITFDNNYNNVTFIPFVTFERSLFTNHGLHLNWRGKLHLANILLYHTSLDTDSKPVSHKAQLFKQGTFHGLLMQKYCHRWC